LLDLLGWLSSACAWQQADLVAVMEEAMVAEVMVDIMADTYGTADWVGASIRGFRSRTGHTTTMIILQRIIMRQPRWLTVLSQK